MSPNSSFTSLRVVTGSRSPAITRMALFGAYQVSWKRFSMRAVVFFERRPGAERIVGVGVPANILARNF